MINPIELFYIESIVAFFDILGFSQKVTSSNSEILDLIAIKDTFDKINRHRELLGNNEDNGVRKTFFSDCFVISHPLNKSNLNIQVRLSTDNDELTQEDLILIQLLTDIHPIINIVQVNLALSVRGGISIGNIFHEEGQIFGPALNEAYHLESKEAKYPRVIISEDIFSRTKNKDYFLNGEMVGIRQDNNDGRYFLDHLAFAYNHMLQMKKNEFYSAHIIGTQLTINALMKKTIETKLLDEEARNLKEGLIVKAEWYINYFNQFILENNLSRELNMIDVPNWNW